jgi:hypothetical protein
MIGNTGFIVLTVGDEAFLKLGETREKLSVGMKERLPRNVRLLKPWG